MRLQLDFYDKQQWQVDLSDSMLEVRQYLTESTLMCLYQNYYFKFQGKRINEYIESQIPDQSRVQIELEEFNERTARYHVKKVQELINNLPHYHYLERQKAQENNFNFTYQELQLSDALQPIIKPELLIVPKPINKPLLSFIGFDQYNPPNPQRQFKGDLFYLQIKTLEGTEYHITASNLGFYVNSTGQNFDPQPKGTFHHNLIELLSDISGQFKQLLSAPQPEFQRTDLPPTLRYNYKWLCEQQQINGDFQRAENWALDLHGFDLTSLRDWNEELQVFRSLPRDNMISKLNRDKALVKVYTDFIEASVKGAQAVVDKIIQPLNPMDTEFQQVYVYNQIFFSFAMETPEDFRQESGPDATPTVSTTNCDFRNLQILHKLDIPGLSVLNTCLIDYKGRRVIAQSIIPGILNSDHSNCTQYGSIDDGKTIQKNEDFHKLMQQVSGRFHLDSDVTFFDAQEKEFQIAGSIEVKGIQGSDKRMYLLDLLRLSPRDLNYEGDQNQCCVLRFELIQTYWVINNIQANAREFLKLHPAIGTKVNYKITEKTEKQKEELLKIAQFLKEKAIPQLIQDLYNQDQIRHADWSISDLFHSHGVNMRYLGHLIKQINHIEYPSVKLALERVVLCKALKHIFREAMREAPLNILSNVLAHLLNCIFGKMKQDRPADQEKKKKKKKKNLKEVQSLIKPQSYNLPTSEELWQKIQQIAQARYQHTVDQRIAGFHKLSCLRELCQSVGLKLIAKDRSEFTAQDIGGIEPILKCIEQSSDDAKANIDIGQKYMNEGNAQALDSFLMATQIIMNLFGSMHRDLGSCLSKISNVYFRRQEHEQAIQFQKQALQIYVNIYGLDHPITISALNGLSLYYFSWKKYKEAFNYMIHALYLTQVVGGEGQEVYNQFTNLSYLYSESGQHQGALNCQFEALERCETLYKTFGGDSPQFRLKLCNYYTAIAMEHGEIGDQQKAVDFQEKALELLKKLFFSYFQQTLKPEDPRIKDSEVLLIQLRRALLDKRIQQTDNKVTARNQEDENRAMLKQKLWQARQNLKNRRL